MARKSRFYFTGVDETKYLCQLTVFNDDGKEIYSFLSEYSGDRLNITKSGNEWQYYSGRQSYLESWVKELGNQVDSGEYQ